MNTGRDQSCIVPAVCADLEPPVGFFQAVISLRNHLSAAFKYSSAAATVVHLTALLEVTKQRPGEQPGAAHPRPLTAPGFLRWTHLG